jgi:hypothetical protein
MKPGHNLIIAAVGLCLFLGIGIAAVPQSAPPATAPAKYELSEVQKQRLQLKQKDAQIAQLQLSIANSTFQQSIAAFNAEVKSIEEENKWPDTLQIDPNTMTFKEPPAPPKPAEKK